MRIKQKPLPLDILIKRREELSKKTNIKGNISVKSANKKSDNDQQIEKCQKEIDRIDRAQHKIDNFISLQKKVSDQENEIKTLKEELKELKECKNSYDKMKQELAERNLDYNQLVKKYKGSKIENKEKIKKCESLHQEIMKSLQNKINQNQKKMISVSTGTTDKHMIMEQHSSVRIDIYGKPENESNMDSTDCDRRGRRSDFSDSDSDIDRYSDSEDDHRWRASRSITNNSDSDHWSRSPLRKRKGSGSVLDLI